MKKIVYIFLFLFLIISIIFFFTKNNSKNKISKENSNTEISRISAETNTSNNTITNTSIKNESLPIQQPIEEDLAAFSTKIYTKESARQNNLIITSSALNGSIIKSGETFSFTTTVGKASPERGYQKADIFDASGNKVKGYGGRKLSN